MGVWTKGLTDSAGALHKSINAHTSIGDGSAWLTGLTSSPKKERVVGLRVSITCFSTWFLRAARPFIHFHFLLPVYSRLVH